MYGSLFLSQGIERLVYAKQISLHVVINGQTLLPKIAIVDQSCFILMVLHGSYTYFEGLSKNFFSIDQRKILQNCG